MKKKLNELQSEDSNLVSKHLELHLLQEMDELLKYEEMLWRDKTRSRWLVEGDANTHFYHNTTISHKRHNPIHRIFNRDNVWLIGRTTIEYEFFKYFTILFSNNPIDFVDDLEGFF